MPGCSIALWLLQLQMLTPLDEYAAELPIQVRQPEVFVDDATVMVVGRQGTVVDLTVRAARGLVQAFEEGAGLPVSRTKGQVTSSNLQVARDIAHRLRALGCKSARTMKVLGVDTAAGRGGIHKTQRIRLSAMGKRSARLWRLKKVGAKVEMSRKGNSFPAPLMVRR